MIRFVAQTRYICKETLPQVRGSRRPLSAALFPFLIPLMRTIRFLYVRYFTYVHANCNHTKVVLSSSHVEKESIVKSWSDVAIYFFQCFIIERGFAT